MKSNDHEEWFLDAPPDEAYDHYDPETGLTERPQLRVVAQPDAGRPDSVDQATWCALLAEAYAEHDAWLVMYGAEWDDLHQYADLSWALTGKVPDKQQPEYLERTDGLCLFYRGKVNGLVGAPSSAKSMLAKWGGVAALNAGERVAYLDVDHNGPVEIAGDLMQMGADPAALADKARFRIVSPETSAEVHRAVASLAAWRVDYVIVDSYIELVPLMGAKSNDNDEVAKALRAVVTKLANAGACVVPIDHLSRASMNGAANSDAGIGAIVKKTSVNGTMVRLDVEDLPTPGAIGRVALTGIKNRIGTVFSECPPVKGKTQERQLGTFVIDSTVPNTIRCHIEPPAATGTNNGRLTHLMERVSRYLELNGTTNRTTVKSENKGKRAQDVVDAMNTLLAEGYIAQESRGTSKLLSSVRPYREDEDPKSDKSPEGKRRAAAPM